MLQDLAGELIDMAEEQFAAQHPLRELLERDPTFATWATTAHPTVIAAVWEEATPPRALVRLWEVHDRHDRQLAQIVEQHGWPGRTLVGADGADAAWVVAQHADRHQNLRRSWLVLIESAVMAGEADPRHLARLTDRVALLDGRDQGYGTYAHLTEGGEIVLDPPPLGSVAELEARRGRWGLPPLADDLREPPDAAPYRYLRSTPAFQWP